MADEPWLECVCDQQAGGLTLRCGVRLRQNWTVLFGPSGTGKSTWLRLLAGLVPQTNGSMRLHGVELRCVAGYRRRVALVEQSPALFPHLDLERNIGFAAPSVSVRDRMIALFRLEALRKAPVATLSGGERQRAAIARALASQPRLLLLDEVFTGMDAALQTGLIAVLRDYCARERLPVLSVTHDVAEVFATADEVLRMQDGAVIAQGSPAEVLRDERAALLNQLST